MAWQGPYEKSYPDPNSPQNPLNGFKDQNLDDDAFGPSAGNIVSAFDAFRTQDTNSSLALCPGHPFPFRVPKGTQC